MGVTAVMRCSIGPGGMWRRRRGEGGRGGERGMLYTHISGPGLGGAGVEDALPRPAFVQPAPTCSIGHSAHPPIPPCLTLLPWNRICTRCSLAAYMEYVRNRAMHRIEYGAGNRE